MKEATGELNMTVITVVAIAAIAAFFMAFVWPALKNNITRRTYCATAVCTSPSSCSYVDDKGVTHNDLDCTGFDTTSNPGLGG